MSKRTKKVSMTGRFGPRYGVSIRRRVLEVETRQRGRHTCPKCAAKALSRASTGIWACRKCGHKYAGGAYFPETAVHKTVDRAIRDAIEGKTRREEEEKAAQARETARKARAPRKEA
ncbi:MAG TPA: 50S ribosomal protein L37ae [Candidatus Thermoplasmatota archaeon]|jgi:large subunit ribosomal protein L37Ae|nr:50S ribosomal protein L37ae [Candidatus Thermoplasmatota archaeon]